MQKRHKEITTLTLDAGLIVDSITPGANGHTRVILRAPNDATKTFMVSTSPGDVRSDKNAQSDMRRWARENPGPNAALGPIGEALIAASKPPAPSPAPTPAADAPARTRVVINKLSHSDFYKMCEWVKTADLAAIFTFTAAAQAASAALEQPIGPSSIQSALEATGIKLPEPPQGEAPKDRTRIIARELVGLLRELGKEPSPELLAILGGKRI